MDRNLHFIMYNFFQWITRQCQIIKLYTIVWINQQSLYIWQELNMNDIKPTFWRIFFLNESKTFWLWGLILAGWRSWDGETFKFISTLEFGLNIDSFREKKVGKLYVIWWFLYRQNLLFVSKFVERREIKGRTTKSEKAFTVTFFCPNW